MRLRGSREAAGCGGTCPAIFTASFLRAPGLGRWEEDDAARPPGPKALRKEWRKRGEILKNRRQSFVRGEGSARLTGLTDGVGGSTRVRSGDASPVSVVLPLK